MGIPGITRQISATQQVYLIDHVDGWRPVTINQRDDATRASLIHLGFIRYDLPLDKTSRPQRTVITEKGREAMGHVLGWMCDQLRRTAHWYTQSEVAPLPALYEGRRYDDKRFD